MGQKVHPYGIRVGYIKPWKARWFAKRDAGTILMEDLKIRKYLKEKLAVAGVSSIEIDRASNRIRVRIFAAKPGVIIGRRGQEIDKIKEDLADLTKNEVFLDIKEVKMPQIDAQLVAENIALQLEKRIGFRRAMKKAIQLAMQKGALGIKVMCKGRLGGAEIAREEKYHEGKVPLGTFRADVDFGFAEAFTTYGTIGCKAWIYKGDVLVKKEQEAQKLELEKKFKVAEEETVKAEGSETEKPASEGPAKENETQENKGHAASA
ncbi:MAG TPA: 30S ribosomal protein S3 [Candidatus Omnitrophota bacterium]|nr:30S ribosomal protein S3 [Candidatus Omnitrophota bacterium]